MFEEPNCIRYVKKAKSKKVREDGDGGRFAEQALAHTDFLMRLARKLTGDKSSAEDLFQDTYLKAYRAFDRFDGESRCRAWLKKIMLNTYINMYNRRQKIVFFHRQNEELSRLPDNSEPEYPQGREINEEQLLHNFVCDEIRQSLLNLPDEYRMAVILYDMLGISYKEIADTLSLPIGTVKSRLFRGRKYLKEFLKENSGNGNGHGNGACP